MADAASDMNIDQARGLLYTTGFGDKWTERHTAACELLGLDIDNFRADPAKPLNWPADMLGTCVAPEGLKNAIEGKPLMQVRETAQA